MRRRCGDEALTLLFVTGGDDSKCVRGNTHRVALLLHRSFINFSDLRDNLNYSHLGFHLELLPVWSSHTSQRLPCLLHFDGRCHARHLP